MHAIESYTVYNIDKKQLRNAHCKITPTYYLNIGVQAANIYQIAESNRIETFLPELECSSNNV